MTAQAFWDRQAPKYAKKPIADVTAYEEKLHRIKAMLRSTDHVLEVGCGTGGTAREMATVAAHVTATDISTEMIRIAKQRTAPDTSPNVAFRHAEAGELIDGHPFDAVFAFSLLHLVGDIPGVLGTMFDQVKPGGHFVSKTVCLKDAPRWIQWMVRALMAVGIAPDVAIISRDDLTDALTRAGFEVGEVRYFGKNRTSPFIIARKPLG